MLKQGITGAYNEFISLYRQPYTEHCNGEH